MLVTKGLITLLKDLRMLLGCFWTVDGLVLSFGGTQWKNDGSRKGAWSRLVSTL